jgi:phosphotransferase system IIA component
MNEKLQYATMLEIPVNTCSVTLKEGKKKRFFRKKSKNPEAVKEQLMNKINTEQIEEKEEETICEQVQLGMPLMQENLLGEQEIQEETTSQATESTATVTAKKKEKTKKFKFSLVTVQFAIIGVLLATIFLTSALYKDSGINVFFRSVFGTNQAQAIDLRSHKDFSPVIAVSDEVNVSISDGVMTFSGEGSVYAPCDGKVTSITKDQNGKYSFEITHSNNFKSVISGLDFAYAGLDDAVYSNIPVGYVNTDGATMCFKGGDGLVISNYQLVDGSVVWAV